MKMEIIGDWATGEVTVNGEKLDPAPSQKVWNHSPTGVSWGYRGSGCAQLALALLLHAGVDQGTAIARHQALKEEFVARLPQGDFDEWLFIGADGTTVEWSRQRPPPTGCAPVPGACCP